MFPECTPLLVTAMTLMFRTLYVMNPRNWWMVHPDEVYQSVEVAHIHLYGYGFRSHEFSPRDQAQNVSQYRGVEQEANMYALKSPLYPYFYVLVGWLAWLFECQYNPYILWRVAHVFVSSTLPLAVHRYVCRLHKSRKAACVAAVMAASSLHLNVLGTHCLVQSFSAPISFFSLALVAKYSKTKVNSEPASSKSAIEKLNPKQNKSVKNNSRDLLSQNKRIAPDLNSNSFNRDRNFISRPASHDSIIPTSNVAESRARELIARGQWQLFCAGFLMCLVTYIHPDACTVYLVHFILFDKMRCIFASRQIVYFGSGIFCAFVVGLGADFHYFGFGVISPWNCIRADLSDFGLSGNASSSSVYWNELTSIHGVGFLLAMAFLFETALFIHQAQTADVNTKNTRSPNVNTKNTRLADANTKNGIGRDNLSVISSEIPKTKRFVTSHRSFLVWVILLTIYLVKGPKEFRFLHDVFVFIFVYASVAFIKVKRLLRDDTLRVNALRIVLVIFAVNQWIVFPDPGSNSRWVFRVTKDVQDVNACLWNVSTRPDVTGVFYGGDLRMTGGMTLLHRESTLMAFFNDGFHEYGAASRRNLTVRALLADRQAWVLEFSQASNYVAGHNILAAARVLIQESTYNYVIVRREAQFLPFGFDEVSSTGNWRVLKRSTDPKSKQMLQSLLERIPIGANATLLLHEGRVLQGMNQFQKASVRLQHAIHINPSLLDAYVHLQGCYQKLGNMDAANNVKAKCLSVFNERKCNLANREIII